MSNMVALVKAAADPASGWRRCRYPEIGPNDVLVKVRKSAICRAPTSTSTTGTCRPQKTRAGADGHRP